MLTQGWRRYVWDNEPTPQRPLLTDGVSGMQIAKRDINGKTQVIQACSSNGDAHLVITDSLGRFEINSGLMEKMPGQIYLKSMLKNKDKAKFFIVNPFDTINVHRLYRPKYLIQNQFLESNNGERFIGSDDSAILLKEVVVNSKRKSVYRNKMMGYLDSLANSPGNVPEWVCVHTWRDGEKRYYLNDYREGYTLHPIGNPCMQEKKKPVPGEKYLMVHLEPNDHIPTDGKWVLADWLEIVYPKRTFKEEQLLKQYGIVKAQGYYPKREFYQPDSFDLQSSSPDPRNLLQWQPEVITDDNGVAEVSFAASDINTEFIGIVEAIDGNGLMGCQTFSFRVLKK